MPSSRYDQQVIALRSEWAEVRACAEGVELSDQQKKEILPMERLKMVMTRGKDDEKALYELLGIKAERTVDLILLLSRTRLSPRGLGRGPQGNLRSDGER